MAEVLRVSDIPQGPGWWQASDGRWYPPQPMAPGPPQPAPAAYAPPAPYAPPPVQPTRTSSGTKGCLIAAAIVGGLLLLGGIGIVAVIIFGLNRAEDAIDDFAAQQAVEADDVEVVECTTDASGFMAATVRVTNQSPERSSYFIDISFESEDGNEQTATAPLVVTSLAPGQATDEEVGSFTEAPDDFVCAVGLVERVSDET
ncbi:MAG: hypothetical protein ACRD29_25125 [Acidimicrobiales bacterium]